ncbi:hypothetical protein [Oceanirhabdus seepicola]|uniref:Uncharacterized protein n=1 Tax=Oceanirhabdus seepicola TaxID=2828781 RepID=A0A9J6P424_9CLOT|nr:hypothetical protein [Oceanirhabdus seepicola]MCM1991530.1 hypothetical protein [Oceanirhabdus seepicola]
MKKKSGIQEAIVTCVGGFLLCMFITGAAYEQLNNMLVFMGIIFLCGVIVCCTYSIVNAINGLNKIKSTEKNIKDIEE